MARARVSQSGSHGNAANAAFYGVLAALALVVGYLEVLFPLPIPVPGIKLGLGNIVVLFALLGFGWKAGFAVMIVKVAASSLLFGNPSVFLYSLAGGAISCLAMCAAVWCARMSVTGVSMVGGVFHMLGQLGVVAVVLAPYVVLTYASVLLVAGLATGAINGYLCKLVIRTVGRSSYFKQRRKQRALKARVL